MFAGGRTRGRWPPRRRAVERPRKAPEHRLPICHTPSCPRPPELQCVLDWIRGRRRDRRGRIQQGMDTVLDRRGVQRPGLVTDHQARAGRVRPDRLDTGVSTERRFQAVRDLSILMQSRNAQPQAPVRLMTNLHLGTCPIDFVRKHTGIILLRMILDNKSPSRRFPLEGKRLSRRRRSGLPLEGRRSDSSLVGRSTLHRLRQTMRDASGLASPVVRTGLGGRAVSDADGLRTFSHHPETSFHRRLSADPTNPARPSRRMVASTETVAANAPSSPDTSSSAPMTLLLTAT